MAFDIVTLDFQNDSFYICFDDMKHLFSSKQSFLDCTDYPFTDTIILSYEPVREIFTAQRIGPDGPYYVSGKENTEFVWIEQNRDKLISAMYQDGFGTQLFTPSIDSERSAKLFQTDWMVTRHKEQLELGITTTLTNQQYTNLLNYRQQLRDITKAYSSLDDVVWPLFDI